MFGGGQVFIPSSHCFSVARPSLAGAAGALPESPSGRGAAPAPPACSWGPLQPQEPGHRLRVSPCSQNGGERGRGAPLLAGVERSLHGSLLASLSVLLARAALAAPPRVAAPHVSRAALSSARQPSGPVQRGSARPGRAGAGRLPAGRHAREPGERPPPREDKAGCGVGLPAGAPRARPGLHAPRGTPARLCSPVPNAAPCAHLP